MADAMRKRNGHYRLRREQLDSSATLHSARRKQAARARFDLKLSIALRRSRSVW